MSSDTAHAHGDHSKHYVKIWGILLVLLIVSICGPMIGVRAITLLTAFGIAVVKAVMVAREFMHLKFEKRFISYMLLTMLLLMCVFFFAVAPDVMKATGQNWEKPAALEKAANASGEHE
jgi:caa(3)-type oxidase subunit IV